MNISEFFISFPEMSKQGFELLKKQLILLIEIFKRIWRSIEAVFDPVLYFLVWFEKVLQNSPWY